MDKQILNFTVNEQILVCENPIKISTNKVNYIQAHFDLGQNWQGYDSIRAIWFNDFQTISTVLDSQGITSVPFEVMKRKGCVKVNLVGSISEDDVLTDRLTSYPVVAVIVDCTAQITGANTSPITPSEFEQFAQRVHTDAERAEQGASNAETSAQNASDSATSAHNSAESAHDDKIAIEEAIAEVIQQIEDFEQVQVVVNTLPPTSPATSDFTDGVLTLGIPQGVKGDTGNGIQSIAKVSTSGLVDTYRITYTNGQTTTFTVTNGAKGDTGNGISNIEKTSTVGLVDTYTITYTNGNTTTFTVTNGEKGDKGDTGEVSLSELEDATVVQTLSDNVPYNYRRTNNGNGAGVREYDEIVGASVGWNQLSTPNDSAETTYGVTVTPNADGTVTVNGTSNDSGVLSSYKNVPAISGHKYLMFLSKSVEGLSIYTSIGGSISGTSLIRNCASTGSAVVRLRTGNGKTYNNVVIGVNTTDLTLALGSTIADYVYSLEQSTAGSGVTWLKTHFPKLFDNGYQPFDSGSIKSVSGLTAHEMVGFNAFDKSTTIEGKYISDDNGQEVAANNNACTDFIEVVSGASYYIKSEQTAGQWGAWYDADKVFISGFTGYNRVLVAPQNAKYVRLTVERNGNGNRNTFCINLSETSINGQYFPHEKHTYPLDSSVTLRGQYKLNNGQLKAVGDVWKSDGTITRNYGVVDLGTLTWTMYTVSQGTLFRTESITDFKAETLNMVTPKYIPAAPSLRAEGTIYANNNGTIDIIDSSFTSASDFKTAMSGVYLVYELVTPTTETATPYTSPQWCDSHGTEEYVGSELPVGHNTDYPMTLIDTADGLSNGTYEPRITVANGKKTVTWVSV